MKSLQRLLQRILNLAGTLRGDVMYISDSADVTPIAVNATATVYTKAIPIQNADNIGYSLTVAGTSPNVTITPQESAAPPAAANINGADPGFVTPVGVSPVVSNFQSQTTQIGTLSLVPMKWLRFQIVGNAGNSANTKVTLALFMQELVA